MLGHDAEHRTWPHDQNGSPKQRRAPVVMDGDSASTIDTARTVRFAPVVDGHMPPHHCDALRSGSIA
jgi:hypothetical protein